MARVLENTIRYPTSIILRGADHLGVEIAKSLLEQGGYVIIIDQDGPKVRNILKELSEYKLFTLLDFSSLSTLEEDLRRLDYVFYLQHQSEGLSQQISSQEFLQASNYLDSILDLTAKFEAKFLLTTSIRAHQLSLTSRELDVNFGSSSASDHTVYTDFEIQRYSESLVNEYQEKVGIDARVIRVGQILGKGIELNLDSEIMRLMVDAIEGRDLIIKGDGLESDYYIHYLDAAYGVLKSQFSMNTKGRIFTLANEEEVTTLSVAYKLLELEPNAKEIKFNSEDNSLPPLKLYKPAPNLSTIGWKPRVSFERSLSQSLEFIKDSMIEVPAGDDDAGSDTEGGMDGKNSKKGIFERIRDFFFIVERDEEAKEVDASADTTLQGALSRLISERKTQERARKGSIVLANTKLRKRLKPEQERSLWEKFTILIDDQAVALKKRFYFLRNITLTDFVFLSMGLVAFVAIYFVLLSPVLSLAKNIYFIKQNFDALAPSVASFNLSDARSSNDALKAHVVEAQQRVGELQYLFDVTRQHEIYLNTQNLLSESIQMSNGLNDVFAALVPLETYIKSYQPGIVYRYSDTNSLSTSNELTYESLIEQIRDNQSLLRIGFDRIDKSNPALSIYMQKMPDWVQDYFGDNLLVTGSGLANLKSLEKSYVFLPKLLGNDGKTNYLIVFQDNARYTAGGGDIAGFVYLEMDKGVIKNIQVKNADELNSGTISVDTNTVREINLVSNKDVSRDQISLSDISLISDENILLHSLETFYERKENKQLDMVITLNLNFLEEYLARNGEINYQQLDFNSENLLSNINLLIGDSQTASSRNEVVMNLFSQIFAKQVNEFNSNFLTAASSISELRSRGDLRLGATAIDYRNFLTATADNTINMADKIWFGLNYDQKSTNLNKYPIVTLNMHIRVNKDLTTHKTIDISASGAQSLQNSYICSPSGSRNFEFSGVAGLLVSNNFTTDKACTVFLEDDDLKYGVEFDTLPFENQTAGSYNYSLGLFKNPGIGANYDIEFEFDSSLNVIPEDTSFLKQGDSYIYSGVFEGNNTYSFSIN